MVLISLNSKSCLEFIKLKIIKQVTGWLTYFEHCLVVEYFRVQSCSADLLAVEPSEPVSNDSSRSVAIRFKVLSCTYFSGFFSLNV